MVKWIKRAVWLLFIVMIGYLLTASIFSTCYLGEYQYMTASGAVETNVEHTFYIRDAYLQHIVLFLAFSCLLLFFRWKGWQRIFEKKYFGLVICIAVGVISALIVAAGQYYPKFDQKHVIEAAAALNEHDHSDFAVGNYLFVFPFQMGVILYYQLLSLLFGNLNYVAFEIVNAVWIVLTVWLFMKIAGLLWEKEKGYETGTAVLCLLFLPYLLYVTFLYGTVVGMAFALLSFYTMLLYERERKLLWLLISGLSMGIATVVKSNYMIFMIAEIIYLLLGCISDKIVNLKKNMPRFLLIAVLLFCFLAGRCGVNAQINRLNDGKEVKGIPMLAWVAMGLQDGKGAPGWYNGYNNGIYIENDYDYDKTQAAVKEEIKRIVTKYPQDITTTISFFVKKVSSQWNNPTFQSLWILEKRKGANGLDWLLQGNGRYLYILFVNLLHTWILAGTFMYALFRYKTSSLEEIILPITFIGGFVFHIFWEAECLYAILYFPLLLPLGICGYGEWGKRLCDSKREIMENGWKTEAGKCLKRKLTVGLIITVLVCACSYTEPFAKMIARNENTGAFDTYTQETVNEEDALPE